jgi:hypothetical protein
MREPWRPLLLAAAITVTVGVASATAQTVIVKNAPPGSPIELVLNTATVGSGTANATGDATLVVKAPPTATAAESSAHVWVDACDKMRRVFLVEPGLQPPPPEPGCTRSEIAGLFVMRRITTFVVDVGGVAPALWLKQGAPPAEWLRQAAAGTPLKPRRRLPTGLVVFGGGSYSKLRDAAVLACGNVTACTSADLRPAYAAGVDYWITRFIAAEASYMKPLRVTASGAGDTFNFDSFFDARVVTLAGKVGVPIGAVRFYGKVGANYHRATTSTTETINDIVITVGDTTQTVLGGTQTIELKTSGLGWLFGGGLEGWVTPGVAIYLEGGRTQLKGNNLNGGEGSINDRMTYFLAGLRVHIGR